MKNKYFIRGISIVLSVALFSAFAILPFNGEDRVYGQSETSGSLESVYRPFVRLECEDSTRAYRESLTYASDRIVYKVSERRSVFSVSSSFAGSKRDLEKASISISDSREIKRDKTEKSLFSTEYEVTYVYEIECEDTYIWDVIDGLSETEGIINAEPEFIYSISSSGIPDKNTDWLIEHQWYLDYLRMPEIWEEFYGQEILPGQDVVVAVIDTGVDYTHKDLADNMWINYEEYHGTEGVDDDDNGYIDDIYGIDTENNTSDPMDDHGHGTHVAGIIAMTANNGKGGAGIAYGAKIMAVKSADEEGDFSSIAIAEGVYYALDNGADIINMSFGGYGNSFVIEDALVEASENCVLIAAAGNEDTPDENAPEEDFPESGDSFPAAYPFVLGVMAHDEEGEKADFSNWTYTGGEYAAYEIIAPGTSIASTYLEDTYVGMSGTSMASPVVAAAAALLMNRFDPGQTPLYDFYYDLLVGSTTETTEYEDAFGTIHSYPRLSIYDSLYLSDIPEETIDFYNIGDDDFKLAINDYRSGTEYSVWVYAQVSSDIFGDDPEEMNDQWILLKPFTPGDEWTEENDQITDVFDVPSPDSDGNYTVSVSVKRPNGDITIIRNTYTPAEAAVIKITGIYTDGKFYHESDDVVIKDITGGVDIDFYVTVNDVPDVDYIAKVYPGGDVIGNESSFTWSVPENFSPGSYRVEITVSAQSNEHTRTVPFILYKDDPAIVYGEMNNMDIGQIGTDLEGNLYFTINPDISQESIEGNLIFRYAISEPWRQSLYTSSPTLASNDEILCESSGLKQDNYGVYQVISTLRRDANSSADDGVIGRLIYLRDGENSLSVTANSTPVEGSQVYESIKDEPVELDAQAVLGSGTVQSEDMEYSYWRRDARGWVLIRDYSFDSQLTWIPRRIGLYTIQIRAKGPEAGSYEAVKNVEVNVTGAQQTADVSEIELEGHENAVSRVPGVITAKVSALDEDDILYKYIISNDFIYYRETTYSTNPNYTWIPAKAGQYRISVLVKNTRSFGKYDFVQTFTVEVLP